MYDADRQAGDWGIEASYFDVQGVRRTASPTAVERILTALSASSGRPPPMPVDQGSPQPAFQGDRGRYWLLAVQLYAVRSKRNWGHGDFTDLAALVELAADVGAAGIALNPVHMLFPDRPDDASPYSPNSRMFLNPLYIDIDAIPEFPRAQAEVLSSRIARLRDTDMVDYRAVAEIKLSALLLTYREFRATPDSARLADFESFRRERDRALQRFAAFETLRRRYGGRFAQWPEPWRSPDDTAVERLREESGDEFGYHEFLQWIADRQLHACRETARRRGLPVGLYLDLAVGVDAGGADAWIEQGTMLNGVSVGAPPDAYNPAGQDWGLTTFNPHGLVARDFEPLREMLRTSMRHAGAIRIDHVLGLMRLYLIPHGLKAQDGAYLRFPFTAMLRVIAEESRRHCCIVVGEDLGTVPENFRATMNAWGLWSYLVMLFEREADGSFRPPERYPAMALATFNTHDLPTFAGWMSGDDLVMKRGIGVDPGESDPDRERSKSALRSALARDVDPSFEDIVAFLAATPTRLMSIAIEDVLGVRQQTNVPGTVLQHPNWRRRLPIAVEDLRDDQRLRAIASVLARAGRAPG